MKPQVRIRDRRRGVVVVALLGDGPPKPTGYTGWEAVERPKRVPMTDWIKGDALRLSLPILLDGFREDRSMQQSVTRLENMARKKGTKRPPTIQVSGPVPHSDRIWVLEDLDWGDLYRNERGVLVRQAATLSLLEWVKGDVLGGAQRAREAGPLGPAALRYNVRVGDTLMKIAARKLGDAKRWQEIAELNNLRDPRRKLPNNLQIQLPER